MVMSITILIGMFLEAPIEKASELLTASTAALTMIMGMDYYSKPSDNISK
jgi:hypothetical protein